MDRTDELLEQSNQAGMDFLFTELATALTFLSVAETTRHQDSAVRNRGNARLAYESVLRYQGRIHFTPEEKASFEEKSAVVKQALVAVGFVL